MDFSEQIPALAPNRMDAKPFLVFDFNDIDETLVPELRKLTKASFDLESVVSAAGELNPRASSVSTWVSPPSPPPPPATGPPGAA